jgi:hypothetical protein
MVTYFGISHHFRFQLEILMKLYFTSQYKTDCKMHIYIPMHNLKLFVDCYFTQKINILIKIRLNKSCFNHAALTLRINNKYL